MKQRDKNTTKKGAILIVDDDADFAGTLRTILEANGYEVHCAHDGTQGLEQARQLRPHLVILDVMMTSDTEGLDVSRRMHESRDLQGIPVILVTAIRKTKDLPAGLEPDPVWLPVKTVLEKPIRASRLLAEVARHIAR